MLILILLLGLFLFISAHSLRFLASKTRAKVSGVIGEERWRGFVALVSLIGVLLICLGYWTGWPAASRSRSTPRRPGRGT